MADEVNHASLSKDALMYRSDRGESYSVSKMQTSHLINAIGHHQHQVDILGQLHDPEGYLFKRRIILQEVIRVLTRELGQREPQRTEYLYEKNS